MVRALSQHFLRVEVGEGVAVRLPREEDDAEAPEVALVVGVVDGELPQRGGPHHQSALLLHLAIDRSIRVFVCAAMISMNFNRKCSGENVCLSTELISEID